MPQLPEVAWTPGARHGLDYERADVSGRSLIVCKIRDGIWEVSIDGFPVEGVFASAAEAKAAAVRKAVA